MEGSSHSDWKITSVDDGESTERVFSSWLVARWPPIHGNVMVNPPITSV